MGKQALDKQVELHYQDQAIKKVAKPFSSTVLAKRTYRELKILCHLRHDNVSIPRHHPMLAAPFSPRHLRLSPSRTFTSLRTMTCKISRFTAIFLPARSVVKNLSHLNLA